MAFSIFEYSLLWFFILLSGFSGALFAVKGARDFLSFSFYFALIAALVTISGSGAFLDEISLKSAVFLTAISASGILGTAFFLGLKPEDQGLKITFAVALIAFPLAFLSSLVMPQNLALPAMSLSAMAVFCGALCFFKAVKNRRYLLLIGLSWLCAAFGAGSLIFTDTAGVFWALMGLQGLAYCFGALLKIQKMREDEQEQAEKDLRMSQSLARLKQSKETADQARLLRVIERERELMSELREREMQRTQEMRAAKDLADEANRSKSAFLAVVSHEIRTPMNGIMGMLRLLEDTSTTKQQTEYLQAMKNSGDTMLALLNDILDFEKIESGNMELEIMDFDMRKVVRDVVTLMSGHGAEKSLQLNSNISDDFPTRLKGDPTRIRQVLLNLVSNAIKFTAEGSVTIYLKSTYNEEFKCFDIYCAVEDSGIGISDEAQANLFRPFTQAEKSTSRKYGGTGLGLAICRRLVEAMGGEIQVNSKEGDGSTFYFTLKMQEGQQAFSENALDMKDKPVDVSEIAPMRILVIEDNEMNQRVVKGFLNKDGHMLSVVDSAEEALSLMADDEFDVILCDINLGGMDGIEFTTIIRSDSAHKSDTPVIALTGNVSAGDRETYKNVGMNGFLAKPIVPEALQKVLLNVQNDTLDWPHAVLKPIIPNTPIDEPEQIPAATLLIEETNDYNQEDYEDLQDDEPEDELAAAQGPDVAPIKAFHTRTATGSLGAPIPDPAPIEDKTDDASALFDSSFLINLKDSLPADQLDELLASFLDKTDELVETLQGLYDSDDAQELYDRAHELKGMAANFGLTGVGGLAKEIETAAKNGELDVARPKIKELPHMNAEAQKQLKAWIES